MDQIIYASFSYTLYWYKVVVLKVRADLYIIRSYSYSLSSLHSINNHQEKQDCVL